MALSKARVQAILETNFESTSQMLKAYSPFTYLLSADTDKKIDDFNHAKHVLQEVTSEISKFDKARGWDAHHWWILGIHLPLPTLFAFRLERKLRSALCRRYASTCCSWRALPSRPSWARARTN